MRQPLDNIGMAPLVYNPQYGVFISQRFDGHWYLPEPTVYNGILWPKGTEFNSIFGLKGHNGVDYAAPKGTPYYAVCDGWIIEQTKKETGYGYKLTVLDDKNRVWIYGHSSDFATPLELDFNFFEKGYRIKEGDKLGYVGNTGFSSGPHLHLGVWQYDDKGQRLNNDNGYLGAIDPWPIITGEKMGQFKTQNKGGELRIVLQASTPEQWAALCAVYGIDPSKPADESV